MTLRPRLVHGISAVFLPFRPDGRPDLDAFAGHVDRTHAAGLTPAINMDTGFGPQLDAAQRREVLGCARDAVGDRVPLVAAAIGTDVETYREAVADVLCRDAMPVVFPSTLLRDGTPEAVEHVHREALRDAPRAIAFELSPLFAAAGKIYDEETVRRLMSLPNVVGMKHSSLSRTAELERLALRDRHRPDFRIYTGNDLGIDMVLHGSDYLLGLSTFDPRSFGLRDRYLAEGDPRFFDVNDALQAVGSFAFRDPVPGYKSSAATYLDLTGLVPGALPHADAPMRPEWEREALAPLAARIAAVTEGA